MPCERPERDIQIEESQRDHAVPRGDAGAVEWHHRDATAARSATDGAQRTGHQRALSAPRVAQPRRDRIHELVQQVLVADVHEIDHPLVRREVLDPEVE